MSMYGDILKAQREAAKACPHCHRLMKKAFVNGKAEWICMKCGSRVTGEGVRNEKIEKNS